MRLSHEYMNWGEWSLIRHADGRAEARTMHLLLDTPEDMKKCTHLTVPISVLTACTDPGYLEAYITHLNWRCSETLHKLVKAALLRLRQSI